MSDPRRLTKLKLRAALWMNAKGMCQICGVDLQPGWHADHVIPWKVSQTTNVHEMQALCPACNLKKGSRQVRRERQHVVDLRQGLDPHTVGRLPNGRPFKILVHVVPGGGKTVTTGVIAKYFPGFKIGVIVPRVSLMRQTALAMKQHYGILLREIQGNSESHNPCKNGRGWITTSQTVTANAELWAQEMKRFNYILTVDECHHLNGGNETESAVGGMARLAKVLNLMTGTLESGGSNKIYGLPYRGVSGGFIPDVPANRGRNAEIDLYVRYSRRDALLECPEAIVPMRVHYHSGSVSYSKNGHIHDTRITEVSKENPTAALWTALNTSMGVEILRNGVKHWQSYGVRGSKLLVVVDSQARAKKYLLELKSMGVNAGLAISDESDAAKIVEEFRSGSIMALVSVQMAYEGLDVPDISHLVLLTHIRSRPWIEQALGRAWRKSQGKIECHCFCPEDPFMRGIMDEILEEQVSVLLEKQKRDSPETDRENAESDFLPIGSSVDLVTESHMDKDVSIQKYKDDLSERLDGLNLPQDVIDNLAMRCLAPLPAALLGQECIGVTVSEQEKALRTKIHKFTCWLDTESGSPFGTHRQLLCKHLKWKKVKEMDLNELQKADLLATRLWGDKITRASNRR